MNTTNVSDKKHHLFAHYFLRHPFGHRAVTIMFKDHHNPEHTAVVTLSMQGNVCHMENNFPSEQLSNEQFKALMDFVENNSEEYVKDITESAFQALSDIVIDKVDFNGVLDFEHEYGIELMYYEIDRDEKQFGGLLNHLA